MVDHGFLIQRASFSDLDPRTLYEILRLRSDVFVVEQDCVFLDPDGRDMESGTEHLWISDASRDHGDGLAASLRLLHDGDDRWAIGRIVTRPDVRSTGAGSALVSAGIDRLVELGCRVATISSQAHLVGWYRSFGFVVCGDRYLEDGIFHRPMRRELGSPA